MGVVVVAPLRHDSANNIKSLLMTTGASPTAYYTHAALRGLLFSVPVSIATTITVSIVSDNYKSTSNTFLFWLVQMTGTIVHIMLGLVVMSLMSARGGVVVYLGIVLMGFLCLGFGDLVKPYARPVFCVLPTNVRV